MKNYINSFLGLLLLLPFISSCDENDPTPDYQVIGQSYVTIANVSVSNDEPIADDNITVTLYYVNYDEDPAQSVTLVVERDGVQTTLETFDESTAGFGERSLTYSYTVPNDAGGESITFIGEFRSNLDFPQVEVTEIEVQ